MSICSSGSSQPKAGLATDMVVDGPWLASAVAVMFPEVGIPLGGLLQLASFHLPTFCAADPPADPGMTAADWLQILAFINDPFASPAYAKLAQLAQRAAWPYLCECTSGGTYTPLPTITPPAGMPAYSPPGIVPGIQTTACASFSHAAYVSAWHQGNNFSLAGWPTGVGIGAFPTGLNLTSIEFTMTTLSGSPAAGPISVGFTWSHNNFATTDRVDTLSVPGGTTRSTTLVKPTLSDGLLVDATVAATPTGTVTPQGWTLTAFCNNDQPGGTQSPCCPPDPIALGTLQQILALTTIIQRQNAPFAYVPGTAHTGLTGHGSISVAGILALAAQATTVPSQLGSELGTPPLLFDLGWLNLGTADGYEEPIFLRSQNQLVVPRAGGLITTVGYSLHDGVVMTLQEMTREP